MHKEEKSLPPEEISKELEYIWKGKKDDTLPVYTPVAKKEKGAFVGSIYEKTPTTPKNPPKQKSRWLGKLGMDNEHLTSNKTLSVSKIRRGTNRDAVKEKIASDFYYLLSYASDLAFDVPKARLAELPIINPFTENGMAQGIVEDINRGRRPEQQITQAVHIMSKWVNGYQDLCEAQVYTSEGKIKPYMDHLRESNSLSDTIYVKGKTIPLEGLVELLAASRLLGDVDVLGNGGTNAGFVVQEDLRGIPVSAKIVKVDPGYVFTTNESESMLFSTLFSTPSSNPFAIKPRVLKDMKDIQIGTTTDIIVCWSFLTDEQKSRFLKMMKEGIRLLKKEGVIHYMFWRNNQFNQYANHALMIEDIIKHYSSILTLLLEKQEEIYGMLFKDILPDDKEQIKIIDRQLRDEQEKVNQLKQSLSKEKQESQNKEKTYQQTITAQNQQLQNAEQTITIQQQQLQSEQQKTMILSQQLNQKYAEIQVMKSKIQQLEKALQESSDREMDLSLQLKEYQKEEKQAKQGGFQGSPSSPSSSSSTAFWTNRNSATNISTRPTQAQQEELTALLKWVLEGHLVEAEKLLSNKPQLALMEGTVTDLSGREFKNITPLQYAFWSLDVEMMEVVMKYMDKGEALSQITAFEKNPQNYSQYGVHYDVSDLVKKTNEYIKNYDNWSGDRCVNHWQTQVGGAQRMCPAWMIYGMCEEGENAAWCKKDARGVGKKRDYEKKWSKWWFEAEYNGGFLGFKFGLGRGASGQCECTGIAGLEGGGGGGGI